MRGSTIGGGGDTTISSPGRSPKQPLPGLRLHDPPHGRQACPEFIAFDQGVGQIYPRQELFSCRSLLKQGQIRYIPAPPQSLNWSHPMSKHRNHRRSQRTTKCFDLSAIVTPSRQAFVPNNGAHPMSKHRNHRRSQRTTKCFDLSAIVTPSPYRWL